MKKVFKSKAYKDKLKGHKDGLLKLFSPDGPESGVLLSASKDGCIREWDLLERKITTKLLLSRGATDSASASISATGYLNQFDRNRNDISDDEDDLGNVGVYSAAAQASAAYKLAQSVSDQITAVCFSKSEVYTGYEDGVICQWHLQSGELLSTYKGHSKAVTELEFLHGGQLVSASRDATIRTWDVKTGLNELIFHLPGPVDLLRISKKKKNTVNAIIDKDTFVEIDVLNSKVVQSAKFMDTVVTSFIEHENVLIIATTSNIIEVYSFDVLNSDPSNMKPQYIVEMNKDWILTMNEINGYLYTGGDDRRIKVWDIKNKLNLVEDFVGHEDGVVCLAFADKMLYSGSFDHSIRSWSISEMESRIRERQLMFREDIWSRKYDAWYKVLYKKKAKKGGKKKK